MKYQLTAKFDLVAEGFNAAPGEVVATIESDVPQHQLLAVFRNCDVDLIDDEPVAKKSSAKKPQPAPTPAAAPAREEVSKVSEPEQPALDLSGFPGLDPKLATPLVKAGIKDSDALEEKIDQTDFKMTDLDGIGKAAEKKILKYLQELGNPSDDSEDEE